MHQTIDEMTFIDRNKLYKHRSSKKVNFELLKVLIWKLNGWGNQRFNTTLLHYSIAD